MNDELYDQADCEIDEHGKINPEPGARILVVTHGEAAAEEVREKMDDGQADAADDESALDARDVAAEIRGTDLDDVEYARLQELAKKASGTDLVEIKANEDSETLITYLQDFQQRVLGESNATEVGSDD